MPSTARRFPRATDAWSWTGSSSTAPWRPATARRRSASRSVYSFQLSVPGQEVLPAAGVTFVAVLPTHRRRGVLRSLMRRQLADVRDRGEPLAMLWASESVIYSRYGYGRASWYLSFTFRRGEGTLAMTAPSGRRPAAADRRARGGPARAGQGLRHSAADRPGFFGRNDAWWRSTIYDPAEERHGASPLRCLLAEDGSGPRGYALYSGEDTWTDFLPENVLTVRELMAVDPAASATLWADLLSRDLTSEFRVRAAPGRRPAAVPAGRPAADPAAADRRLVGPDRRRTRRAGRAQVLLPGRRGHRGAGRDPAVQRRAVAADDHR